MDIHEAAARYVRESGKLRTSSSQQSFMKIMRLLASRTGGKDLRQITTRDLTEFCTANGVSPSTQTTRRAHMRSFFEWAAYHKLVLRNPASDLKYTVVPGRHKVRDGKWLSEEEIRRAIDGCDEIEHPFASARARILLQLGFMTGLRATELANLRWGDLSPDGKELATVGKGQKRARVGVPPQLRAELAEWRTMFPEIELSTPILPALKVQWTNSLGDSEHVVLWNTPIGYDAIRHIVNRAGERVGLQIAPHDMRRTFAGLLEAKGVPVTDISRAMRHGDVGVTSRYLDTNPAKTANVTKEMTFGF